MTELSYIIRGDHSHISDCGASVSGGADRERNHNRRRQLLASTAFGIAGTMLLMSPPVAHAANECGAPVGGVVTCNGDGVPATDVPNNTTGIRYSTTNQSLTVVVDGTTTPIDITTTGSGYTGSVFNAGTGAGNTASIIIKGDVDITSGNTYAVIAAGSGANANIAFNGGSLISTGNYGLFADAENADYASVVATGVEIEAVRAITATLRQSDGYAHAKQDGGSIVVTGAGVGAGVSGALDGAYALAEQVGGATITFNRTSTSGVDYALAAGASAGYAAFPDRSADAIVNQFDSTIETTGFGAGGIGASAAGNGDATVNQTNSYIHTAGANSNAIFVQAYRNWGVGGDATVEQIGSRILTEGANSTGIEVNADGAGKSTVNMTMSQIETRGVAAEGISAYGTSLFATNSTEVSLFGSTVRTAGYRSNGIYAVGGGGSGVTVSLEVLNGAASSVTTTGEEAHGILARTGSPQVEGVQQALVTVDEGTGVFSSGLHATGVWADVGVNTNSNFNTFSTVIVDGTVMGGWGAETLGNAAIGVKMSGRSATTQLLDIGSTGQVGALSDFAILGTGHGPRMTIENAGLVTGYVQGGGSLFKNQDGGLFDVRAFADTDGDGVRDEKAVSRSSLTQFDNEAGAVVRLASVRGHETVDTTGQYVPTYGPAGFYDIGREGVEQGWVLNNYSFNHAGVITLQDGVAGDVFGVTYSSSASSHSGGTFTSQGGSLYLDTVLNQGGAAASLSDILVVDGTQTQEATRLHVLNAGGAGAKTTGNGILVVEVRDDTRSAADAFALANGPLFAGAYEYNLFKGGITTPNDGDWYLRSQLSTGAQTANPYADALIKFGQLSIGTLQQRTGNRLWPNEAPAQPLITKAPVKAPAYGGTTSEVVGGGLWGRLVGQHGSYDPSSGAAYDADTYLGQVGAEGVVHETGDGALVVGLIGTYGSQDIDVGVSRDPVTGARRRGSIDTDAYGAGFNVTWLGTDGLYVDGVGQYTWYDSDLSSSDFGRLAEGNHGDGYALSLEIGKRLALSGGWSWVPQAQLIYSSVDFDDFTMVNPDDTLTRVSAGDGDSLLGRIGVRLETLGTNGTQRFQGYGIVNLTYEFLDGTSVRVGATELDQQGQDFWGEIGLGGTYAFNDRVSLYGEARYASSLEDAGDSYSYGGNIGLRVNW